MDANLGGSRSRRDRSDSIQRVGTAPPDVQEPQLRESPNPFNIGALVFVPSFIPSYNPDESKFKFSAAASEFNPATPAFVPIASSYEPIHQGKLSAAAISFEPGKLLETPELVPASTSANNIGKWSSGPPSLGSNSKTDGKTLTKGSEEAKDIKNSVDPDSENSPQTDIQNSPSQDLELKTEVKNDVTPGNEVNPEPEQISVSNDLTSTINEVSESINDAVLKIYTFDQIMAVAEVRDSIETSFSDSNRFHS